MNLATELFRLARRTSELPTRHLPAPTAITNTSPGLERDRQVRYLVLGTERQLHYQAARLCDLLVTTLLDYADPLAWGRQREGLVELARRFFRRKNSGPALAWAAPVWVRTNQWARRAGLVTKDETGKIKRRGIGAASANYHPLRFAGGEGVKVNVKKLRFFYPELSTTLVHVPRYRKLYTLSNRLVGVGYEEGLGLGTAREEQALAGGNYTPNELFFQRRHDLEFLDLMTVTFARFASDPPAEEDLFAASLRQTGPLSRRRFSGREAREFSALLRRRSGANEELPVAATVRFLRITFHPADLSVVVLLAAERELPRFIAEHDGLAQLLVEQLAYAGIR